MNVRRSTWATLASLGVLAIMTLAFTATSASAAELHIFDSSFGSTGTGPGQLRSPAGIAVSDGSGDVYVADEGNGRIQEFDATGTPLAQFDGVAAPTGALSNPREIAVDNSGDALDPSENDVYASGEAEGLQVIYKFSASGTYLGQIDAGEGGAPFSEVLGVAVDPSGELWVYQASGEIDNYTNELGNRFLATRTDPRAPSSGFAVDSEDNLYVNVNVVGASVFAKLDDTGTQLIERIDDQNSTAAAVDLESNDVYVDNRTSVGVFNSAPECATATPCAEAPPEAFIERFGEGHLSNGTSIAVNWSSPNKLVYVADPGSDAVRIFEAVLLPTVKTAASSQVGSTSATINGSVDPEGLPVSSCVFEYGATTAYGQSVPCEPNPGSGTTGVPVAAHLASLVSDTTYHYRVVATNENGPSQGADESFTTTGPGVHGASVVDVSGDSATFQATVNPHGVATSIYFQYGTTVGYGTNVPAPPGLSLGSGEGDVTVTPQRLHGLVASTLYHYRVVVISGSEQFFGLDQTFTTEGPGGALTLPDGRAWELVSSPDKHGGTLEPLSEQGSVIEAAASGNAITYLANAPTEAEPQGFSGMVQVLSQRGVAGWRSQDIQAPNEAATGGIFAGGGPNYYFFSEDLSAGLLQPFGLLNPNLSPEASEQTPYLRTLEGCIDACYHPLVSGKPGYENVLPDTHFGGEERCELNTEGTHFTQCGPQLLYATSDLKHVILESAVPLTKGAPAGVYTTDGLNSPLYEWSDGHLMLISVLPPNGAGEELPAPIEPKLALGWQFTREISAEGSARSAVSNDGARVFWQVGGPVPTLYVRDTARQRSLQIDAAEPTCLREAASTCESGGGHFQIASADGSRVLFTDPHHLTKDAGAQPGEPDLYECEIQVDVSGTLACKLTDLTPERAGERGDALGGVLGASEDDSVAYFVAKGVVATAANRRGETATAGQPNLYVRRAGSTSFIATLASGDVYNWNENDLVQPAQVSPSGRWLSFMSERPLTGYDNRDAISGKSDAEVYLYDAVSGQLVCASCLPSGARPLGVELSASRTAESEQVAIGESTWAPEGWVAALTAPATQFSGGAKSAYRGRFLSDSGRLFFNSLDASLPQDVNGNWDVYEYEPPGVPSGPYACGSGSATFSARSDGCVALISSGSAAQQSGLLDASASGGDVFFLTSTRLVSQDFDASRDVYDAHECTSSSPCFPQKAVTPPPCTTEASCKPPPSPQPEVFGAPASATFDGHGNLVSTPEAPSLEPKTAAQARVEKLIKTLRACRKDKKQVKRVSCEKQARKRYGPNAKSKRPARPTNHKGSKQ